MNKFKWYRDARLQEQLDFFGAKKKGFISCYAKQVKPRIRIENKQKPKIADKLISDVFLRERNGILAMQYQANQRAIRDQQAAMRCISANHPIGLGVRGNTGVGAYGGAGLSALTGVTG